MPSASFFAQLGWFVVPKFLDADTCIRIREEMARAPVQPASILNDESQLLVDLAERKTDVAMVTQETRELVTFKLKSVLPALSDHFKVGLAGCEPASFLIYRQGAFFRRHSDSNHRMEAPAKFRERKVSVSIFLNSESKLDLETTYSGGALAFSGARRAEGHDKPGLSLKGEEGVLIGFDSSWLHEVQPVQRGVRYSIVTWFA